MLSIASLAFLADAAMYVAQSRREGRWWFVVPNGILVLFGLCWPGMAFVFGGRIYQ
ncbi:MAG TPA: hypothetical protein VG734_00440 [Lacunisphaera sp.]|nr:hypothetical protein [Lacunisphaera sp.]